MVWLFCAYVFFCLNFHLLCGNVCVSARIGAQMILCLILFSLFFFFIYMLCCCFFWHLLPFVEEVVASLKEHFLIFISANYCHWLSTFTHYWFFFFFTSICLHFPSCFLVHRHWNPYIHTQEPIIATATSNPITLKTSIGNAFKSFFKQSTFTVHSPTLMIDTHNRPLDLRFNLKRQSESINNERIWGTTTMTTKMKTRQQNQSLLQSWQSDIVIFTANKLNFIRGCTCHHRTVIFFFHHFMALEK